MFYDLTTAAEIAYAQVRTDTDPATYAEADQETRAAVIGLAIETPEIHDAAEITGHALALDL